MTELPAGRDDVMPAESVECDSGRRRETGPPTTVELFAGIGGFRLAADARGLRTVWANDDSAEACAVYRSHFGDGELVEDDIRERLTDVPDHDLLTAGFPCQPFSYAGKKDGLRDPRGSLFEVVVDVLTARLPRHFILENVESLLSMAGGDHFATILRSLVDAGYLVEWRVLDAADFGLAQRRRRVFLLGTLPDPEEPHRLRIRLRDRVDARNDGAAVDLSAQELGAFRDHQGMFSSWGMAGPSGYFGEEPDPIDTGWGSPPTVGDILVEDAAARFDFTESTLDRIQESKHVDEHVRGVHVLYNQEGGRRMGYTIFDVDGLAPTLTSTTSRHYERYRIGDSYRRLTPTEYARLQGFPDGYCDEVPLARRYVLLGQAVPPRMVSWVLSRLGPRYSSSRGYAEEPARSPPRKAS